MSLSVAVRDCARASTLHVTASVVPANIFCADLFRSQCYHTISVLLVRQPYQQLFPSPCAGTLHERRVLCSYNDWNRRAFESALLASIHQVVPCHRTSPICFAIGHSAANFGESGGQELCNGSSRPLPARTICGGASFRLRLFLRCHELCALWTLPNTRAVLQVSPSRRLRREEILTLALE